MKRWWLMMSVLLVGCVGGDPATSDTFCTGADTVVVGQVWNDTVTACYERPTIRTKVSR